MDNIILSKSSYILKAKPESGYVFGKLACTNAETFAGCTHE